MAGAIHQAIKDYDVAAFRAAVDADPSAANARYNWETDMDSVPATALECLLSLWYHVWEQETRTLPTMTEAQIAAYREMVDILMAGPETDIQPVDDDGEFEGMSWLIMAYLQYIECLDERDQTRWAQFADYAAHVIRKYNERADYDPNELREVSCGGKEPDWVTVVTMTDDHEFVSTVLDALLEHPDIHPSKLYKEPAGNIRFTDSERMSLEHRRHFRDRLARARAQRLWGKVRLWRFTTWWWTTACEAQYAPGEAGCLREKDMCRDTMEEICNKRARFA